MSREVRVASYNIRKAIGTDRMRRPERILAVLNEIDADVVALQEADRRLGARQSALPADLVAQAGWRPVPYDIRPGGIGWHGNAILVRPHVRIERFAALTLPVLEPRGAVMADLAIGALRFRIVGMHLDLSGLWRRRQARSVIAHVEACAEPLPTVLAGDLNEWSMAGGCLREFTAGYHLAQTPPSFHARRPVARLDRIMANEQLSFTASATHRSLLARAGSDHLPIWADVVSR